MSTVVLVRLLGRPQIEREGDGVAAPRGRKSWAVWAYLVLAELPVPPDRLASWLFADADDPLGHRSGRLRPPRARDAGCLPWRSCALGSGGRGGSRCARVAYTGRGDVQLV